MEKKVGEVVKGGVGEIGIGREGEKGKDGGKSVIVC